MNSIINCHGAIPVDFAENTLHLSFHYWLTLLIRSQTVYV